MEQQLFLQRASSMVWNLYGKKIGDVKFVIVGAGAAGISSANLYIKLGADPEKIYMLDTKGFYGMAEVMKIQINIKNLFTGIPMPVHLRILSKGLIYLQGFLLKDCLQKKCAKKWLQNH